MMARATLPDGKKSEITGIISIKKATHRPAGTRLKRNFIFLDEEHRSKEYQAAMDELTFFVQLGKNVHDDAPDGLTQLQMFIEKGNVGTVTAMRNPVWGGRMRGTHDNILSKCKILIEKYRTKYRKNTA